MLEKEKPDWRHLKQGEFNPTLYEDPEITEDGEKVISIRKFFKTHPTISTIDDVVEVRVVMQNTALIVGAVATLSLLLNAATGVIIVDPMISVLLIVGAAGFFFMSKAKS
jgi:hypothetical protein